MANPDTPLAPVPNESSTTEGSFTSESSAPIGTDTSESTPIVMAEVAPGFLDNPEELYSCCEKTIEDHGINNAMMVCAGCKQIIKRFEDVKAFQAYIKFCRSRNRTIYATTVHPWYIVIFKSYASFST